MKKLLFISAVLLAGPANWEAPQCQRPACEVDGACPDVLLGFDPLTGSLFIDTVPTEETVAP